MKKISFDRDWRFNFGDLQRAHRGELDDSTWQRVNLPHDWSIGMPRSADNPSTYSGGYFEMGRGWYRKVFTPEADWSGKQVLIEFEGIYMNAEVWCNEHFLGRHPYGYTSFSFDLSPYLVPGEENAIRVRVDNSHQLNSRWYSGSGIYRHVWLHIGDRVHFGQYGIYVTTPQVAERSALVRVQSTIESHTTESARICLRSRVITAQGDEAGVVETNFEWSGDMVSDFSQDINIEAPRLWSPDSPTLYRLESKIEVDGKVMDTTQTMFGIRTLEFSAAQGFRINGQVLKLKGGCVHHDNGILGSASFDRAEERKVELHKANGYNAIRCAHNPPAPAFLDACDRLGIMVIDEAFDCWRQGKNLGDYHVAFDDWWQRDLDNMVLRDRNHPSIIIWSIGNEIIERDGRGGGAQIAKDLADRVRAVDPTRPVTAAICGVGGSQHTWQDMDPVFSALDVGGYNYQLAEYRADHERLPKRMMIGTESMALDAFDHWMSVEENPYVLGDFIWTSLDYLGESGIGRTYYEDEPFTFLGEYPWHQANCGDLDLCGFKRPQSYYRDILWKTGGPLYIGVHAPVPAEKEQKLTRWGWPDVHPSWTWPGEEGRDFQVFVYSACDQVEMFLNGRSLGLQPSGKDEKFTATFSVPYEAGELKAVGIIVGKPAAEISLHTAGEPASLSLSPDRAHLKADGQDLSYVTVELLDAQGRMHPCADREVFFTVQGAGSLAAVGSANPTSTESYVGHARSTYHGRCLAALRAGSQPGTITLRAQADGVAPAEVVIQVK